MTIGTLLMAIVPTARIMSPSPNCLYANVLPKPRPLGHCGASTNIEISNPLLAFLHDSKVVQGISDIRSRPFSKEIWINLPARSATAVIFQFVARFPVSRNSLNKAACFRRSSLMSASCPMQDPECTRTRAPGKIVSGLRVAHPSGTGKRVCSANVLKVHDRADVDIPHTLRVFMMTNLPLGRSEGAPTLRARSVPFRSRRASQGQRRRSLSRFQQA